MKCTDGLYPNSRAMVYEQSIIILINCLPGPAEPGDILARYLAQLEPLLKKYHLTCGVSTMVDSIAATRAAYEQAVAAEQITRRVQSSDFAKTHELLDLLGSDQSIYCFEDYATYYTTWCALEHMESRYLCLPQLRKLAEETTTSRTKPIRLLFAYLQSSCHLTRTAELLYMHRNSILYHIRRIEEKTGLDLGDFEVQVRIRRSLETLLLEEKAE